jgi:hypothetical protein
MTVFSPIPRINAIVEREVAAMGTTSPYDLGDGNRMPLTVPALMERLRERLGDEAARTIRITIH